MSTNLTTIFGNEIKVHLQPVIIDRQYSGFPGAHGLTAMHMGSRGYPLTVTGKLASSGVNYTAARAAVRAVIDGIEDYLFADAADYVFFGVTYYSVVWEKFQLLPDGTGKVFHYTSEGYCTADFIMLGRSLL